jgi:NADPH-dependent ferric siderophore reductase
MSLSETANPFGHFALFLGRKGRRVWRLAVTAKRELTPNMVRVEFQGADLNELAWKPGQDLVLELPDAQGRVARRHYTIRTHDPVARTLAIDFVLHGDSPAGDWVRAVQAGDEIAAAGPRGHTFVRSADWHLFIGDETAIPAIFAMLESLPRGARAVAFLEIADDAERQSVRGDAEIALNWLPRNGRPAGPSRMLPDAVEDFQFPQGLGHAYILGETSAVRAIRQRLIARGLGKDQTCAEGYWRPGRVGGHDHA